MITESRYKVISEAIEKHRRTTTELLRIDTEPLQNPYKNIIESMQNQQYRIDTEPQQNYDRSNMAGSDRR